jgi:hypothetical protein
MQASVQRVRDVQEGQVPQDERRQEALQEGQV